MTEEVKILGSACKSLQEVFAPTKQNQEVGVDDFTSWMHALKAAMPVVLNVLLVLYVCLYVC